MQNSILLATGNRGKAQEILDFFEDTQIMFQLLSDFPAIDDVEETGSNFEENALIKAKYFGNKFQVSTIGEDSGLILEAFPNMFGLKTRREFDADTDEAWLEQFMTLMDGIDNRRATFYSSMAFYDPVQNIEKTALGKTSGIILHEPTTPMEQGIPISAVFVPNGSNQVYSAMSKSEKNEISHRGKSSAAMAQFLEELLNKK